jgi:hypothetical protein
MTGGGMISVLGKEVILFHKTVAFMITWDLLLLDVFVVMGMACL